MLDSRAAHDENLPQSNQPILAEKNREGHLTGRAILIRNHIYIVIYGNEDKNLSQMEVSLLRRSYPRILHKLKSRSQKNKKNLVDSAQFINRAGEPITP